MRKYLLTLSVTGAALLGVAAIPTSAGAAGAHPGHHALPSKYAFLLHGKKGNLNSLGAAQRKHVLKLEKQAATQLKAIRAGKPHSAYDYYLGTNYGYLDVNYWADDIYYDDYYGDYFGEYLTGPDSYYGDYWYTCTEWIYYGGYYYFYYYC